MNPAIVYVLAGFLAGVFGGTWKPFLGFKKPPPTAQVSKLQAELMAAQAAAEQAKKAEQAARAEERTKLEAQVRAAQQDNLGTETALRRVPAAQQGPEVKLAGRMAQRVSLKLASAIGRLPQEEQEAMVGLIDQALSDKQAEVDAANARLAKADADFKILSGERDALKAEIPRLAEKAAGAEKTAASVQADLAMQTTKVNEWAAKTDAAERKAGSFFGAFASMRHWAYGIGMVALALAGVALYLRMGLGSVGAGLHELEPLIGRENYDRVVDKLDARTDRLHQWMIAGGKKIARRVAATEAAAKNLMHS